MKLLLKFNLVFLLVFSLGFIATAWGTRSLLERHARDETLERARLMMEKAAAVRNYTAHEIAPLLQTQMKYAFLPQSVPAFSATEVLAKLAQKYPDYAYKEATLNPTNLRDRAVDWEVDIVSRFRTDTNSREFIGERETPSGTSIYVARPLRIEDAACLQCHSTVDAAPKPMLEKYGTANGFGWNLHEVVGAQIVSVPLVVALERAHSAHTQFLWWFGATFVGIAIVLNALLWWLVVRPVTELAKAADAISQGRLDVPEPRSDRDDEIGGLVTSFGRMHRSVIQAMQMIR